MRLNFLIPPFLLETVKFSFLIFSSRNFTFFIVAVDLEKVPEITTTIVSFVQRRKSLKKRGYRYQEFYALNQASQVLQII